MTLFIQTDATGAGAGTINPNLVALNLGVVANGDTGLGVNAPVGNRQTVTYAQTLMGTCQNRLNALVNTVFMPDYGLGAGPQQVDVICIGVGSDFVLNDGSSILTRGGTALPPSNSGLGGATLNGTNNCLVLYDTTQNNNGGYCTARAGSGGALNLDTPNSVILYHELSHAFRIVNNTLLSLAGGCDPSSPEENAAITEENDLRTQIANAEGEPVILRDAGNHCGNVGCVTTKVCCIIASVASGSPVSPLVQELRALRDGLLRRSEVGHAFFGRLFFDYYSFSPQVCTLMAGEPQLPDLVLKGYVEPLLLMLRAMTAATYEPIDDETLGRRFLAAVGGPAARRQRLAALDQAGRFWRGDEVPDHETARKLAGLLQDHALPSEHVRWALVEPVRIFQAILRALPRRPVAATIGRDIRAAIDAWVPDFPIDPIWASLPLRELTAELENIDAVLLKSEAARARFRRRLLARFETIPPIRQLLGGTEALGVPA
ncbi:MAG TPA: hypothetical protein VMG08_19170 [Allosphingosinicella sp.]|nr:hypothetical protein [Allosphingosinicella sp.]